MTAKKKPEDKKKVGAPPGSGSKYKPEYCEMLVEHMKKGYPFTTFGVIAGVAHNTISDWAVRHTEFADARKRGHQLLEQHYIDMGRALAAGQLRRVKSEKPMLVNGKPVYDDNGQILMEREYEQAHGNATAWIFLTKNVLGWRNENVHVHRLDEEGKRAGNQKGLDMTAEERMKEIRETTKLLEDAYLGEKPIIEIKKAQ